MYLYREINRVPELLYSVRPYAQTNKKHLHSKKNPIINK